MTDNTKILLKWTQHYFISSRANLTGLKNILMTKSHWNVYIEKKFCEIKNVVSESFIGRKYLASSSFRLLILRQLRFMSEDDGVRTFIRVHFFLWAVPKLVLLVKELIRLPVTFLFRFRETFDKFVVSSENCEKN